MPVNTIQSIILFYVNKDINAPCWQWIGATTHRGYSKITINYKTYLAHRVIYEHFKGPILEGLQIDHVCKNKLCVNPEHLETVTPTENVRRYTTTITHCKEGHSLSGDNLYMTPDGRRNCKACRREAVRRCMGYHFA